MDRLLKSSGLGDETYLPGASLLLSAGSTVSCPQP